MSPSPAPTTEQSAAIAAFHTQGNLVIEAGAGTGKTSTLVMLAESAPGRTMQYIAFNRSIVEDCRAKMPSNVLCRTAHSMAYQSVGKRYSRRLRSRRMTSAEVARILGVNFIKVGAKTLSASFVASLVMRAVRNFCRGAEAAPSASNVPYVEGIDEPTSTGKRTYSNNQTVRSYVMPFVARAWADMTAVRGDLPFSHDCYLKIYQLKRPQLKCDVILFDEAQDANPVIAAIIEGQRKAQRVYVGDSQQQIYEFTGAVNAMQGLSGERAYLSQSFRFGQAIADQANAILGLLGSPLKLRGADWIESSVGPVENPRAILCRTNSGAIVACLAEMEAGRSVHLVGGGEEVQSFCRAAIELQAGRQVQHRDLACFSNWDEVRDYVATDELGQDLALMVRLIDEHTAQVILDTLRRMVREDIAEVTVSTAHKAKGREWETVRLGSDFPDHKTKTGEPREISDSDYRLLYVAITRARVRLDVSAVAILHHETDGEAVTK